MKSPLAYRSSRCLSARSWRSRIRCSGGARIRLGKLLRGELQGRHLQQGCDPGRRKGKDGSRSLQPGCRTSPVRRQRLQAQAQADPDDALPGVCSRRQSQRLRLDVAPGVSTNPEAVPKCSIADFTGTEMEVAPGVHAFTAPDCPESEIGENIVTTVVETKTPGVFADVELKGKVYNLEQPNGLSSDFGVALSAAPVLEGAPLFFHTFIEGHVEWASDYHDLFEIKNIPPGYSNPASSSTATSAPAVS